MIHQYAATAMTPLYPPSQEIKGKFSTSLDRALISSTAITPSKWEGSMDQCGDIHLEQGLGNTGQFTTARWRSVPLGCKRVPRSQVCPLLCIGHHETALQYQGGHQSGDPCWESQLDSWASQPGYTWGSEQRVCGRLLIVSGRATVSNCTSCREGKIMYTS